MSRTLHLTLITSHGETNYSIDYEVNQVFLLLKQDEPRLVSLGEKSQEKAFIPLGMYIREDRNKKHWLKQANEEVADITANGPDNRLKIFEFSNEGKYLIKKSRLIFFSMHLSA